MSTDQLGTCYTIYTLHFGISLMCLKKPKKLLIVVKSSPNIIINQSPMTLIQIRISI